MSKTGIDAVRRRNGQTKTCLDASTSNIINEMRNVNKALQDLEAAKDPKKIKEAKVSAIDQSRAKVEGEQCLMIANFCMELNDELFKFLTDGIVVDERRVDSNVMEIEERINYCLPVLKELRKISDNEKIDQKNTSAFNTIYERLFNALIEHDPRFILFAPEKCYKNTKNKQKRAMIKEPLSLAVDKQEEKFKEDKNADYVSLYQVCEFEPNEKTEQVQDMLSRIEDVKKVAIDNLIKNAEDMASKLFQFIVEELKLEGKPNLTHAQIKAAFNDCEPARKKLVSIIREDMYVGSKLKERAFDPYDEMFNKLVDLDIKFALYAPRKVLARLDLDFKLLNEAEKDSVFNKIQKMGLWDNPKYVDNYHHVFACQIAKTNDNINN